MSRVLSTSNGTPVSDYNPLPVRVIGASGGADGKSAYEIAVDNGFEGDESAWLLSLKGEPGKPGNDGEPGKDGDPSKDGDPGTDGKDATQQFTAEQVAALLALIEVDA